MPSRARRQRGVDSLLLADQLHSAAIHLLRQLRREDDAGGISAPRLSALSVVVFSGPLTLGRLAAAEQVKPPTMTRIVTGLERDGLVVRKNDPRDRRLTQIQATARGRQVMAAARARRVQSLAAAVKTLEPGNRVALDNGVRVLSQLILRLRSNRGEKTAS